MQSSTGEVADLDAIAAAAEHHGALTVVDATHAIGWLPLDATRFDALACARLQVADVPARHGVHGARASELAERMTPASGGLVRRRRTR